MIFRKPPPWGTKRRHSVVQNQAWDHTGAMIVSETYCTAYRDTAPPRNSGAGSGHALGFVSGMLLGMAGH